MSNFGIFDFQLQKKVQSQRFNQNLFDGIVKVIPLHKSIIDIGAGVGNYVKYLREEGYVAIGIDGTPKIEKLSKGLVKQWNLAKPIDNQFGEFDWGLFIEVGEHIPKEYENVIFSNLNRLIKNGLILSWAHPYHPGRGHINTHTEVYVACEMGKFGWCVNDEKTVMLRDCIGRYYKNKFIVFEK